MPYDQPGTISDLFKRLEKVDFSGITFEEDMLPLTPEHVAEIKRFINAAKAAYEITQGNAPIGELQEKQNALTQAFKAVTKGAAPEGATAILEQSAIPKIYNLASVIAILNANVASRLQGQIDLLRRLEV